MPVDPSVIGTELAPISATMEAGRLRAFAKATGQAVPAGDTLPVPPTFLFGIELEAPDPFAWVAALGIDLRTVLHGEQRFDYHRMAYAGETLTATSRIEDVYSKRGGALEFIVKKTAVTDPDGGSVADLTSVIVVRNPEVKA